MVLAGSVKWKLCCGLSRENEILDKIHALILELRSSKVAGKLRQFTSLQPEIRNKTRWLSTMSMVDKYLAIKKIH